MIRPRHSNHLGGRQSHDLYSNTSGSNIIFPLAIGMGKIRPRQFLLFLRAGLYCDSMICKLKHFIFFNFLLNLIIQPKWGLLCSSFLVFLCFYFSPPTLSVMNSFFFHIGQQIQNVMDNEMKGFIVIFGMLFSSAWNESNLSCVWNHSLDS